MATSQPAGELFRGPHSLRFQGESAWFWIDLIFAPATVGAITAVLHTPFQLSQIGLIIALAVVYVTLARGRLLGTSVRVHEQQFPELFAIVSRCSRMLGMRMPNVFVREDILVPITAMGLGEPYSIVISSAWLRHLDEQELAFLVGCELAHIAAGHTRISSLFSASGRENPVIALVFGAWLRRTEYTAGRVGLLCCRSLEAAVRAIYATGFREIKGDISHAAFLDQRAAIERDPSLAMGEWLSETPYAVNRMRELERFAASENYAYWAQQLDQRLASGADLSPVPERPVYASLYLRSLAFITDAFVVGALGASGAFVVHISRSKSQLDQAITELNADPDTVKIGHWLSTHVPSVGVDLAPYGLMLGVILYSAVMVSLIGRTCGMLVFDLHVVRSDWKPARPLRVLWRYGLALASIFTVVPVIVGLLSGFWVHERFSGTRLVRGGAPRI